MRSAAQFGFDFIRRPSRAMDFVERDPRAALGAAAGLPLILPLAKDSLAHRLRGLAPLTLPVSLDAASDAGPRTAAMTEVILASRRHAQQAFRSAMGLISLAKAYTPERLEAACDLALEGGANSYRSVKSILTTKLDQEPRQQSLPMAPSIKHDNIRGGHYYH